VVRCESGYAQVQLDSVSAEGTWIGLFCLLASAIAARSAASGSVGLGNVVVGGADAFGAELVLGEGLQRLLVRLRPPGARW
jgi:hypothetical protein